MVLTNRRSVLPGMAWPCCCVSGMVYTRRLANRSLRLVLQPIAGWSADAFGFSTRPVLIIGLPWAVRHRSHNNAHARPRPSTLSLFSMSVTPPSVAALEVDALLQARLHDPFRYLGLHREGSGWMLRVFHPRAEALWLRLASGL